MIIELTYSSSNFSNKFVYDVMVPNNKRYYNPKNGA